jgi:hypothetical protein
MTKFGTAGSGNWNYFSANAMPTMNVVWQGTSSNATYCPASSALTLT